jgi:hypothetical protein
LYLHYQSPYAKSAAFATIAEISFLVFTMMQVIRTKTKNRGNTNNNSSHNLHGRIKKKKYDIQNWDSYTDLLYSTTLTTAAPDPENSTAVIVIDESLRRKLGKLHILELVQKLTSPEMNCYVDIIPTGTSDNEVIKVFNSYVNIPAIIVTSDKGLCERLPANSLFIKTKKGSNAVRVITQAIRYRISRL